jgi:hypothetical protein
MATTGGDNTEHARRVKALLEKTQAVLPRIMDDAIETGDFSKVEKAQQAVARLSELGNRTLESISGHLPVTLSGPDEGGSPEDPGEPTVMPPDDPAPEPQGRLSGLGMPGGNEGDYSDIDLALERAKKIDHPRGSLSGLEDIDSTLADAQRINSGEPPDPEGLYPEGAGTLLERARKLRESSEKPDFQVSSREENPPPEEPEVGGEIPPPSVNPLEGEQEPPPIEKVAPKVEQDFGGNPLAVADDIERHAEQQGASESEREFLRRVKAELGERPKAFTITKLLAALALGAGSIVGAWLTHRYSGQALVDLSEDQKDYDKRRGEIGREVYHENKALSRARENQAAMEGRLSKLELGRDARQEAQLATRKELAANTEAGRDSRLSTQEAGKGQRLDTLEGGRNARQDKQISAQKDLARLRADLHPEKMAHWSDSDKQESIRLRQAINNIDRNMMFSADQPGDEAKKGDFIRQLNDLIERNRQAGK